MRLDETSVVQLHIKDAGNLVHCLHINTRCIVLRDEAVALLMARAQVHISDLEHVVLVFVLSGSPLANGTMLFRNGTGDGSASD